MRDEYLATALVVAANYRARANDTRLSNEKFASLKAVSDETTAQLIEDLVAEVKQLRGSSNNG